jgi:hypothetical protein
MHALPEPDLPRARPSACSVTTAAVVRARHQRQRAGPAARRCQGAERGRARAELLRPGTHVARPAGGMHTPHRRPSGADMRKPFGQHRGGRPPGAARPPLAARMRNTGASTRPLNSGCTGVQQLITPHRIGRDSDTRGPTTAGGVHALASASGLAGAWPTPDCSAPGKRRSQRQLRAQPARCDMAPMCCSWSGSTAPVARRGPAAGQRAPVCEFAAFHRFRRSPIRDERRANIHQAFLLLSCSLICWRNVELKLLPARCPGPWRR